MKYLLLVPLVAVAAILFGVYGGDKPEDRVFRQAVAQPSTNVDGDRTLLLPVSTSLATLKDCDRAWKMDGKRQPRRAIVINQTLCEPRTACPYGGQVYIRTCYDV